MENPNYITELFNVLKNETRLCILQSIVNGRYSLSQLQQKLKQTGHNHSQVTITEEYLRPLMSVGLVAEVSGEYYSTSFGERIVGLLECFSEFVEKLPAHSEGSEETLLQSLLSGPKTFDDIEALVSTQTVSRILKRLRSTDLIESTTGRNYIFFFKSKRDPAKETLTTTEQKIYSAIFDEGISAGKLAKETKNSLRRTYKTLRALKCKKLVFTRKTPKLYSLTCKGKTLASILDELQQTVETWSFSEHVVEDTTLKSKAGGLSNALH
jgi:DNA-binding HxlR family transcriptional regulator